MQICHRKADVSSVSPLLDRLRECGLGVVYKMGVALMGGRRQEFLGVLLGGLGGWGVGGLLPRGKYYKKLESIPPSIFVERKLEFLYVELTSR